MNRGFVPFFVLLKIVFELIVESMYPNFVLFRKQKALRDFQLVCVMVPPWKARPVTLHMSDNVFVVCTGHKAHFNAVGFAIR